MRPQQRLSAAMVTLKDIHFDFDRYIIRPEDAKILKEDYGWFQENPGTRVRIEGNCDERGTVEYNLVLGQKRADSAKELPDNSRDRSENARYHQLRQRKTR